MRLGPIACAVLALSATVSPSYADDFDNAQMVALSIDPVRCELIGGMTLDCHRISGLHDGFYIEGSQVDDVHHKLRIFVPNGRQSEAEAIANGACASATDRSLSWAIAWNVQVIMNGEVAAQCDIARQIADPAAVAAKTAQKAQNSRDNMSDAFLKNLAKDSPAKSDDH